MPTPSVGRVVHYVSYGTPGGEYQSQCRAAIITEVPTNADMGLPDDLQSLPTETLEGLPVMPVGLCVMNPTGLFFNEAAYDEDHAGGTWHWPEKVTG